MNRKPLHILTSLILIALLGVLASSCTLPIPQRGQQPTQISGVTPDLIYTSAVQTIAAQLTEAAVSGGTAVPGGATALPTQPAATQPPAPQATATQAQPTAPASTPTTEVQATQAPTAQATAAATQAPTAAAGDPRTGLGDPVLRDTFVNDDNWPFERDEHSQMEVEDERLEMTAFKADQFDSWALTWPDSDNFYVEMTVTTGECSGLDRYGIIFRASRGATTGYLFGVSCDGKYSLRLWDGKKYTRLVDWTASPNINAGEDQSNRIGVKGEGNKFSLYANGKLLTTVTDDTYDEGFTGVVIAAAETRNFKVWVDEYVIWDLSE